MEFNPMDWKDKPSTETPIIANALNRIEQGIDDACHVINKLTEHSAIYEGSASWNNNYSFLEINIDNFDADKVCYGDVFRGICSSDTTLIPNLSKNVIVKVYSSSSTSRLTSGIVNVTKSYSFKAGDSIRLQYLNGGTNGSQFIMLDEDIARINDVSAEVASVDAKFTKTFSKVITGKITLTNDNQIASFNSDDSSITVDPTTEKVLFIAKADTDISIISNVGFSYNSTPIGTLTKVFIKANTELPIAHVGGKCHILDSVSQYIETKANQSDLNETNSQLAKVFRSVVSINTEISDLKEDISTIKSHDKVQDADIENLKAKANGVLYRESTDSTIAREKTVPSGACPNALLNMFGGMSRKCKNLVDISVKQYSYGTATFENGKWTVTDSTGWGGGHIIFKPQIGNGSYVINAITEGDFGGWLVQAINEDGTIYESKCITDGEYNNYYQATIYYSSQFTTSGAKYYRIGFRPNDGKSTIVYNVMLNEGNTALPYEPYTDQLIDAKVDNVSTTTKNLFDKDNCYDNMQIANGSTGELDNANNAYTTNDIYLKQGESVYIPTTGTNQRGYFNSSKTTFTYLDNQNNVFTAPTNCWLRVSVLKSNVSMDDFQITKGTNPISYIEHFITKTIPNTVQSLDGYGIGINSTCYNYLEWVDDKVLFHKRVGSVDLGTKNYTHHSISNNRQVFATWIDAKQPSINNSAAMASAIYTAVSQYSIWVDLNCSVLVVDSSVGTAGQTIFINDAYTDASSFKSAMNGVILYYELATEVVTDVTSYFTEDFDILKVESGGTIKFSYPNDDKYIVDVPNKETFLIDVATT